MSTVVDADLEALRQGIREVLTRDNHQFAFESKNLDRLAADLGWTGIGIEEADGGLGLPPLHVGATLAELGRGLGPVRVLSSSVLAGRAITAGGSDAQRADLLPRLAAGDLVATVALPHGESPTASVAGASPTLTGVSDFVPDAVDAALILVPVRDGDAISIAMLRSGSPGLEVTRLATADATRAFGRIRFTGTPAEFLGARGHAAGLLDELNDLAAAAIACDSRGCAEAALEMAAEYAKVRVQFGRAIGSFQAVKHHLATGAVLVEGMRTITDYAIAATAGDPEERALAADAAKSFTTDRAARMIGTMVQVMGGIGYTWEQGLHRYHKRALLNQPLYGRPSAHRERIAHTLIARVTSGA